MPDYVTCSSCGTQVAADLLACPGCLRLTHADRLNDLAASGAAAERAGALADALCAWRDALALLPAESRQYQAIRDRIDRLSRAIDATPTPPQAKALASPGSATPRRSRTGAALAGLGALGLAAMKFKFLAPLVLTKAKFLLFGLTKASTLLSMVASVGVYWTAFGWKLAVGLVASIYLHEIGHVVALARYGARVESLMFVPGLGAAVRSRHPLPDARQNALVGLAGPIWGLGAAVSALAVGAVSGAAVWMAIAKLGAVVNLLNLIPIGPLDGSRAFGVLDRASRWLIVFVLALAWALSEQPFVLLMIGAAALRAAFDRPPLQTERIVLLQYIGLVAALTPLAAIPVAIGR